MSLFNEILVGRFSNFLTRTLNMVGGSPAPTVAPEILPVLNVQPDLPEDHALRGDRLCWAYESQSPSVTTYATLVLFNPTNSGVLLVVKRFTMYTTVAAGVFWASTDPGDVPTLGAQGTASFQDQRLITVGATRPQGQLYRAAPIVSIITPGWVGIAPAANTSVEVECDIVLPPGRSLVLQNTLVSTGNLFAALQWRERVVPPNMQRDPR